MPGPLNEWSNDEIQTQIRQSAVHVTYYYADFIKELERRSADRQAAAAERQATAQFRLSVVSVCIAVVAIVVSALR